MQRRRQECEAPGDHTPVARLTLLVGRRQSSPSSVSLDAMASFDRGHPPRSNREWELGVFESRLYGWVMRVLAIFSILTGSVVPMLSVFVVSLYIGPGGPDSIVPTIAFYGSIAASVAGTVAGAVATRSPETRVAGAIGILLNVLYLGGYVTYQLMVQRAMS